MKTIFGSLGSNYSLIEAIQYLWPIFNESEIIAKLKQSINQYWPGEVFLFYKGRHAISCALVGLDLPSGSGVLLSAFTCHAIEEAILTADCVPVYADIAINSTNAGLTELQAAFDRSQVNCKAVIIQHTLGLPAEINKIRDWATDKGLYVIEDLAQAAGAKDTNGQLLGKNADVVILSFGQDKVLDAVSGGACIFKLSDNQNQTRAVTKAKEFYSNCGQAPLLSRWRDWSYPFITWLIRVTFNWKLGQLLAKISKMLGILRSPVLAGSEKACLLTGRSARLAIKRMENLQINLHHRSEISKIYLSKLTAMSIMTDASMAWASHQRFLITVARRNDFLAYLTYHRCHFTDTWYRQAVDSGSLNLSTLYHKGSCPRAESLAEVCLNLPTHRQISPQIAHTIADLVLAFNQRKLT